MKLKGYSITILSAVLFGVNPLLSKQIYAMGGNSVTLTFFRMMITAVTFWIVNAVWMHKDYSVSRDEFKSCFSAPRVLPDAVSALEFLQLPPVRMATTIHFVYPVLVLIGSIVFYHERLTRKSGELSFLRDRDPVSLPGGWDGQLDGISARVCLRNRLHTVYFAVRSLRTRGHASV